MWENWQTAHLGLFVSIWHLALWQHSFINNWVADDSFAIKLVWHKVLPSWRNKQFEDDAHDCFHLHTTFMNTQCVWSLQPPHDVLNDVEKENGPPVLDIFKFSLHSGHLEHTACTAHTAAPEMWMEISSKIPHDFLLSQPHVHIKLKGNKDCIWNKWQKKLTWQTNKWSWATSPNHWFLGLHFPIALLSCNSALLAAGFQVWKFLKQRLHTFCSKMQSCQTSLTPTHLQGLKALAPGPMKWWFDTVQNVLRTFYKVLSQDDSFTNVSCDQGGWVDNQCMENTIFPSVSAMMQIVTHAAWWWKGSKRCKKKPWRPQTSKLNRLQPSGCPLPAATLQSLCWVAHIFSVQLVSGAIFSMKMRNKFNVKMNWVIHEIHCWMKSQEELCGERCWPACVSQDCPFQWKQQRWMRNQFKAKMNWVILHESHCWMKSQQELRWETCWPACVCQDFEFQWKQQLGITNNRHPMPCLLVSPDKLVRTLKSLSATVRPAVAAARQIMMFRDQNRKVTIATNQRRNRCC